MQNGSFRLQLIEFECAESECELMHCGGGAGVRTLPLSSGRQSGHVGDAFSHMSLLANFSLMWPLLHQKRSPADEPIACEVSRHA